MAGGGAGLKHDLSDIADESSGYIESVSFNVSSDTADVKDKDGKVKAKCFYGHKMEATATYISKGQPPKINDQIDFGGKNYFVNSVEEIGSSSDWIKFSVKATHYGKDSSITPEANP